MIKSIFKYIPSKLKIKIYNSIKASFTINEKKCVGIQNLHVCLSNLKSLGFFPKHIIDIGAHEGEWTKVAFSIFDSSCFYLIEALPHKEKILREKFADCPNIQIFNSLVGDTSKSSVPFYSMESGSSVLEENTLFSREQIFLPMITLDELLSKAMENSTSNMLKIDVQGFELQVLKGSEKILESIDVLCLEISFMEFNLGAPLAPEVITKLSEYGFTPFDILGTFRKSTDYGLIQIDMVFIKKGCSIYQKVNNMKEDFQIMIFE